MKHTVLNDLKPSRHVVLIFAGWGMDWRMFEPVSFDGRHVIVAYDYASDIDKNGDELARLINNNYDDVCLIGWSFGVFNATVWMTTHSELPLTYAVAVNGTVHPVDRLRGIDPDIFAATLNGLSDTSVAKFRLRMCGSRQAFSDFMAHVPQRTIESLRIELEQIRDMAGSDFSAGANLWDKIFISDSDRIIPAEAQKKAWERHSSVTVLNDSHHNPDWNDLASRVRRLLVDKDLIAERFGHAAATYDANAIIQRRIATHLAGMLPDTLSGNLLEVGSGTGFLSDEIKKRITGNTLLRMWDLAPQSPDVERKDAEIAIRSLPAESLDMIASASTIQWFQSPTSFFRECHRVLKPGGVAAFATFGDKTFREINNVLGNDPLYPGASTWVNIAQEAGWKRIEMTSNCMTMTFDTPMDLLRHIQLTGVNALRSGGDSVRDARKILNMSSDGGVFPLTYEPVYLLLQR